MLKRMLAGLLVLIMLLTVVACAKEELPTTPSNTDKKKPVQTTPVETDPPQEAKYWVDLAINGSAEYVVVAANSDYADIAETLATTLKEKTGVYFSFSPKDNIPNKKKILVGSNPDTVLQNADELTYNGQVAMYAESIIYITGHHKSAVQRAADRFSGNILDDYIVTENEKVSVKIPDYAFFFYNPTNYSNTSPVLFSHSLDEYKIIVPSKMDGFEPRMMSHLIDAIGGETGLLMKYVTDTTSPSGKEIVIGLTSRPESVALYETLETGTYAIKSVGESIYVAYDNYLVASDAMNKLRSLYNNHTGEAINIVVKPDYEKELVQKQDASHIRVMTTNIVAAGDTDSLEYLGERYDITWDERVRIQAAMIMDYLPDFIGLQEMQESPSVNGYEGYQHTEMAKATQGEYSFVKYDGLANSSYWTPIMYRSSVWNLDDKGYGQSWDNAMHRWQWALFSRKDNPDEKYILINLHNPTSNNATWQEKAAEDVNELFLDLDFQYPDVPIFITGDFNTSYNSPIYKATVFDTDLKTAYTLTDNNGDKTASIDHILVQENLVNVEAYRVIDNGYLYMTSDHRPVIADVSRKQ